MKLKVKNYPNTSVDACADYLQFSRNNVVSQYDQYRDFWFVTVNDITEWTYSDDGRIFFKTYRVTK